MNSKTIKSKEKANEKKAGKHVFKTFQALKWAKISRKPASFEIYCFIYINKSNCKKQRKHFWTYLKAFFTRHSSEYKRQKQTETLEKAEFIPRYGANFERKYSTAQRILKDINSDENQPLATGGQTITIPSKHLSCNRQKTKACTHSYIKKWIFLIAKLTF